MNPSHRISPPSVLSRIPVQSNITPLQDQIDGLTTHFMDQATDGKTLAALTAGGLAYRLGKMGFITLSPSTLLRPLSAVVGLGTEVVAFEGTHRSLVSFSSEKSQPHLWKWEGSGGWKEGLISSATTFGLLKGAGYLGRGNSFILQHLFQDAAMVSGHQILGALGVAPRPEETLAEQWVQAEATNLQMQTGAGLVQGLFPRLAALERDLDLSYSSYSSKNRISINPLFAMATAGVGENQKTPYEMEETGEKPLILQMSSKGRGREEWSDQKIRSLAERAKTDPSSIHLLVELAKKGNETAATALKSYSLTRYYTKIAKTGLGDEALVVLVGLASAGNRWAFQELENLAEDNTQAVNSLYHLARAGKEDSFEPLTRLARRKSEAVDFIARFAHEIKGWALEGLARAAEINPDALKALLKLARVHEVKEAQARFNVLNLKAMVRRASSDAEIKSVFALLALAGNLSARKGIERLSQDDPLQFEIFTTLLRSNPIGELARIAKDPMSPKYLSSLSLLFGLAENRNPEAIEAMLEVGKSYPPYHRTAEYMLSNLDLLSKTGVPGASTALEKLRVFLSKTP
jgi:hypothetical protein